MKLSRTDHNTTQPTTTRNGRGEIRREQNRTEKTRTQNIGTNTKIPTCKWNRKEYNRIKPKTDQNRPEQNREKPEQLRKY